MQKWLAVQLINMAREIEVSLDLEKNPIAKKCLSACCLSQHSALVRRMSIKIGEAF
jgi:hypothetical protein